MIFKGSPNLLKESYFTGELRLSLKSRRSKFIVTTE